MIQPNIARSTYWVIVSQVRRKDIELQPVKAVYCGSFVTTGDNAKDAGTIVKREIITSKPCGALVLRQEDLLPIMSKIFSTFGVVTGAGVRKQTSFTTSRLHMPQMNSQTPQASHVMLQQLGNTTLKMSIAQHPAVAVVLNGKVM